MPASTSSERKAIRWAVGVLNGEGVSVPVLRQISGSTRNWTYYLLRYGPGELFTPTSELRLRLCTVGKSKVELEVLSGSVEFYEGDVPPTKPRVFESGSLISFVPTGAGDCWAMQ